MKVDRVEEMLTRLISAKQDGDRLPALLDLAAQFGCSVNTLRKGLTRLQTQGKVRSKRGSGVCVVGAPTPMPGGGTPRQEGQTFAFPNGLIPMLSRRRCLRFMIAESLPGQLAAWEQLIAAFERVNPGVGVELCRIPLVSDQLRLEEVRRLLADADLFHLSNWMQTRRLYRQGGVLDLAPYVDLNADGDVVAEAQPGEGLCAVPVVCTIEGTLVNRSAAARCGLSAEDFAVDSWAAYKELRRAILEPTRRAGYAPAGSNLSPFCYLTLMGLDTRATERFCREDVQALIEQYIDLIYGLGDAMVYVGPFMHQRRLPEVVAFDATDIWFHLGAEFRRDYVMVPLPLGPGGRQVRTVVDLSVTSHTSYPFAAAEFIRFVLSDDGQRTLAENGRLPAREAHVPRFLETARPYSIGLPQILENAETVWYLKPGDNSHSLLGEAVDVYIENMIVSGKTPEEVARSLYDAIVRFQRPVRRPAALSFA